jgi:RNA polymerase sigma-70 factor, ECF subfamily
MPVDSSVSSWPRAREKNVELVMMAERTVDSPMDVGPLAQAFFGARESQVAVPTGFESELREYLRAARSAGSDFSVSDLEFVHYVAARARAGRLPPAEHAPDLLLACACSHGIASAIETFRERFLPVIARVSARRKAPAHVADDVQQIVQQRLLVGEAVGEAGKIAGYRGSGPLRTWVASVAATTLLMHQRSVRRRREEAHGLSGSEPGAPLEPDLELMRRRYAPQVEDALAEALNLLSERQRTLLRLHWGENVTVDVLGSIYGVSRSTAARWVTEARRALGAKVREILQQRLEWTTSECDSLVALVKSRIELSILRRLRDA